MNINLKENPYNIEDLTKFDQNLRNNLNNCITDVHKHYINSVKI